VLICRVESLARIMERMGCLDYARDRAVALEQYKVLGGYLTYPLALVFSRPLPCSPSRERDRRAAHPCRIGLLAERLWLPFPGTYTELRVIGPLLT
jgi:hypothetical protein